jgi:hypothetical protein
MNLDDAVYLLQLSKRIIIKTVSRNALYDSKLKIYNRTLYGGDPLFFTRHLYDIYPFTNIMVYKQTLYLYKV